MATAIIAGATGYMGVPLIKKLRAASVDVYAIARRQSVPRLPGGCVPVVGSVLDARTYQDRLPRDAVFVHLVGTPHPAPWKAKQFEAVDLASLRESLVAAKAVDASRFVFVSVAHPAPVMRAFIAVRVECEHLIRASGIHATILRPWYVLGPGHRWPYALLPLYKLMESFGPARESALRLGMVTLRQMVGALTQAVTATPSEGVRIVETEEIRRGLS